jgi:DNA-directed RNA polymerase subunit RPC12/RpoP
MEVHVMPQEQREITLIPLQGEPRQAIATGNNAAWMCVCGRELPLLGRAFSVEAPTVNEQVQCPNCSRKYFVVPNGYNQGPVLEIREIQ